MLRQCLAALEKSEGRERLQIVVVENGSMDGSEQLDSEFPDLQWIRLPKNFGLTKAMNLGWRAADAEYESDIGAKVSLRGAHAYMPANLSNDTADIDDYWFHSPLESEPPPARRSPSTGLMVEAHVPSESP